MNKFEDIRNKKIFEVLVIIKVIYILLCVVAMIGYKSTNTNKSYYIYILYLIATRSADSSSFPRGLQQLAGLPSLAQPEPQGLQPGGTGRYIYHSLPNE